MLLREAAALLGFLVLGLGLAGGGVARAADEGQVLRLRAEQLAAEERCAEALPVARRARELDADDARAALLEGQCAIRLKRYGEAIAPLEDARRLDADLSQATLYLGIAHYHQGDLDRAEAELAAAESRLGDSAELQLYRGLVLLEQAQSAEAAAALERAAALDPQAVDPAASYFAGRAWQGARQRERATQALRRVIDQAPGTPWAKEAERALASSEARYRRQAPWGVASAGIEYDSNVVLLDWITSNGDWRGVWFLAGGVELFRSADWAGGVIADYNGSAHEDLHDYDSHFPILSLWLDRSLDDDTYLRLQPDAGYQWLGYDPFLAVYGGTLALHRAWGEAGSGRLFARYTHRDYRYDVPPDPFTAPDAFTGDPEALDRDANEYRGGYEHVYPAGSEGEFRGGFQVDRYHARGREYKHTGYEIWLGGRRELPLGLTGDLGGGYRHERYDNTSTFSTPPRSSRRRDHVFYAQALLERPITDRLKLSVRYRYQNNDSNVGVFDYDRHIVGGYVTVTFGGS